MNLNNSVGPRRSRVAIFQAFVIAAACLVLAACSAFTGPRPGPKITATAPTATPTPAPTATTGRQGKGGMIDLTRQDPKIGDSLQYMSINELSEFDSYSDSWGVEHVYIPSKAGQAGFEGIAPLGMYCLIAITHVRGMDDGSNRVSVVIFSRYNETIEVYARGVTFPEGVRNAVKPWRQTCWNGEYTPTPGDGNVLGSNTTLV